MPSLGHWHLAVTDYNGMLLGLLCLKSSDLGFCTDSDVQARETEQRPEGQQSEIAYATPPEN
jgi:hypothetical protein